jgi:hypothetical protein
MYDVCPSLPEVRERAGSCAVDANETVHGIVGGAFGLAFPDPRLRAKLGLRAISASRDGRAAWYLWTTRHPGAFEVGFVPGTACHKDEDLALAIRYFPSPGERVFRRFAPIERTVRCSGAFDAAGTPRDGAGGELDPSLFHVATLTLHVRLGPRLGLTLEAQDRWLEEVHSASARRIRRDVPGLEIGRPMLDALACSLSYLGREPPTGVRVRKRVGTSWRLDIDGRATECRDPRVSAVEIDLDGLLLPGQRGQDAPWAPSLMADTRDTVFLHATRRAPAAPSWPVERSWWLAAGWRFQPVGTFCGRCTAEEDAPGIFLREHCCDDHDHDRQA